MTDRLPFNEFTTDLEVMPSSDTMYYNTLRIEQESERLDRFKKRVDNMNESNKGFEMYHRMVQREAEEQVFNALRDVSSGRVYFDSIEDIIQQVKLKLKKEVNDAV